MKKLLIAFGMLLLVAVLFGSGIVLGYRVGVEHPKIITVRGVSGVTSETPEGADFRLFWDAWDTIASNHLGGAVVTPREMVYGAIQGLVQAFDDPHSAFFSPADGEKFSQDVEGNFGGIGAEIGARDGGIVVVAPLADTPAERAGLQPNDLILAVNGSSTEGLTVDETVQMIRGPKGTEVALTILRKGWEASKDIPIVRDTIYVPTLDFEMRGDVAYVELHSFNLNANPLFYQAMTQAAIQGARGVVLDLRNNPGGYLDVAVQLAGWFLPRGTSVVSEAGRDGVTDEFRAEGPAALVDLPVVVLVNGGSASASEILAGALRDARGVKLVGEQTFGKGTVQQIFDLADGSSLKLTIAHWVLPSGKVLENEGLTPDIEVVPSESDIASENDVQLTKALEVVREEIRAAR